MTDSANNKALRDIVMLRPDGLKAERQDLLQRALRSIRSHLAMDVAFISEFAGNERTFRYVDCEKAYDRISPGVSAPLEQTYCKRIVDGELPQMSGRVDLTNVPPDPVITAAMPIGSYASIPLRLSDGSVYGTFCAIGVSEDQSLNPRDLKVMHAFAEMAAEQIEADIKSGERHRELRTRVQDVLDHNRLCIVYQPILDVTDGRVIGHESLTRFTGQPQRSPAEWFAEAAEVGLDCELELRSIAKAIEALAVTPASSYISVNASPAHVASGQFAAVVESAACERIVLEMTEHATIVDYADVLRACDTLRERGIRLAIDDAGSGYASFRHILSLNPDFIKLDMSLVQAIEKDSRRQALVAAFVEFAARTRSEIIAEGVETQAALDTLKELGVTKVQGYLIGRPQPL